MKKLVKKLAREISLSHKGNTVTFILRRSRRAKSILLNVDMSGEVEVVVPWRVPYAVAGKFVRAEAGWLFKTIEKKKKMKGRVPARRLVNGSLLPILGDARRLIVNLDPSRKRSSFKEKGDFVEIAAANQSEVMGALERWYREKAREYYEKKIAYFEKVLDVRVNKVVISSAKTQWGSCMREEGRVSLQWRLAQAPLYVVDYVILHELAHLKEGSHNGRFWKIVAEVCPQYELYRRWLRDHGHRLYW